MLLLPQSTRAEIKRQRVADLRSVLMARNLKFAEHLLLRGLKPVAFLAARKPHGTRLRYLGGCKCMLCRAANSRYESSRLVARKNGEWNGIVSANRARRHLLRLSAAGVGRRRIASVTGVAASILSEVKKGIRRRIRARTERRILAVDTEIHRALGSRVSAGRTWRLIGRLLDEGFTKGRIAQEALGNERAALQLGRHLIVWRSARNIERFYRRYMY